MRGALLVRGTASDAGKSVVTAGICRWLARAASGSRRSRRRTCRYNSVVTADGAEIGRAQAMQAAAAGLEPEVGDEPGAAQARQRPAQPGRRAWASPYGRRRRALATSDRKRRAAAGRRCDALAELRARYDVVVCEGAGSPAEINLRDARPGQHGPGPRGRPARRSWSATSTAAACSPRCSARSRCSTPTTRRSSPASSSTSSAATPTLLAPGPRRSSSALTGRPTLGVLPVAATALWLDAEDSLALDGRARPRGGRRAAATRCASPSSGCRWM